MNFIFKSIDHYQLASPKNAEDQSRKFFTEILILEVKKPLSLNFNGYGSNRDQSRFILERRIISFPQEKRNQQLKLKISTILNNI